MSMGSTIAHGRRRGGGAPGGSTNGGTNGGSSGSGEDAPATQEHNTFKMALKALDDAHTKKSFKPPVQV
jgi:hypothetical protein